MTPLRINHPLLAALESCRSESAHRRRRAGQTALDAEPVERFGRWLLRCSGHEHVVDADMLACIARQLLAAGQLGRTPPAIAERMRCAGVIDLMLRDADWQPEEATADTGRELLRYLRATDDNQLIPNGEPVIGRMDDAMLVESAWPVAADEVLVYCDYRRLRLIEAEMRERRPGSFRFDRADYREASAAEAALHARQRTTGLGHYAPQPRGGDGLLLF